MCATANVMMGGANAGHLIEVVEGCAVFIVRIVRWKLCLNSK
jgi:hypothetical protein